MRRSVVNTWNHCINPYRRIGILVSRYAFGTSVNVEPQQQPNLSIDKEEVVEKKKRKFTVDPARKLQSVASIKQRWGGPHGIDPKENMAWLDNDPAYKKFLKDHPEWEEGRVTRSHGAMDAKSAYMDHVKMKEEEAALSSDSDVDSIIRDKRREEQPVDERGKPSWDFRHPKELTPIVKELQERLKELLAKERPTDRRIAVIRLRLAMKFEESEEDPNTILRHAQEAMKCFGYGTVDSLEEGMCLRVIGVAYRRLEQYELSLSYLKRAYEFFELKEEQGRSGTTEHLQSVLQELGETNTALGKHEQALENFQDSLQLLEGCCRHDHADLAKMRLKVAESLCDAHQFKEAKPLVEQAIGIHQRRRAKSKRRTEQTSVHEAMCRRLLGTIFIRLDQPENALEQFRIVRQTFKDYGGQRSAFAATMNIAEVQMTLKRYNEAVATLEEAKDSIPRFKTLDDPVEKQDPLCKGKLHLNFAKVYCLKNKPVDSIEHCEKALEIYADSETNNEFEVADRLVSIALVYETMGNLSVSIDVLKKAIGAYERCPMDMSYEIAEAEAKIGTLFLIRPHPDHEDALFYFGKALKKLKQMPDQEIAVPHLLSQMGRALINLKRYDSALELLLQSKLLFDGFQDVHPEDKLYLFENLVEVYKSLDRVEEARELEIVVTETMKLVKKPKDKNDSEGDEEDQNVNVEEHDELEQLQKEKAVEMNKEVEQYQKLLTKYELPFKVK